MLSGLAPIVGEQPSILILGSMPSVASLEKRQYYGHPRNAFWSILSKALDFPLSHNYLENVAHIRRRGLVIWDVIAQCERKGSLDSSIVKGSEKINPIVELIADHSSILSIGLNGGLAANLYKRHIAPQLTGKHNVYCLPSTSPANASMNWETKYAAWQDMFLQTKGI